MSFKNGLKEECIKLAQEHIRISIKDPLLETQLDSNRDLEKDAMYVEKNMQMYYAEIADAFEEIGKMYDKGSEAMREHIYEQEKQQDDNSV